MPNLAWPSNITPSLLDWRLKKSGSGFIGFYTSGIQAVDYLGEFWDVNLTLPGEGRLLRKAGQLDALLMYLAGGINKVDIYHWARPIPRGTLRGSPTMKEATSRGDASLVLTVAAGSTLEPGDLIGAGTQLFMVRLACAAVGTELTVPLLNRVRGVIAEDSAVVWNKPTVAMVAPELSAGTVYGPGVRAPSELHLMEP